VLTADVAVVGGGPAGAAAAVTLARAGRDVVLVDKAVFPRDKCCGDGLTTGALRGLDELGLDPSAVASWHPVDACWVRSPSGRTVQFPFPSGQGHFGAVARRTDLDLALVELARAAGAKVYEGHSFKAATWSVDGVTITVAGLEPLAARYVIGADGMWSPLRKALGVRLTGRRGPTAAAEPTATRGYLGEWHAFRQYFVSTGPLARRLWVWFEPELLPGYAWSFPLAHGVANVGFGVRRGAAMSAATMAGLWRRLLDVDHVKEVLGQDARAESPHKAWPIPARLARARLDEAGGRALFVGDAARACDPMTGEGIGQALDTAAAAARAILSAGPFRPAAAAAAYKSELRSGMIIDHALANVMSGALRSTKGARGAVRIAGSTGWTRRNFARWLFEDYPRALLLTPHRWHPHMLGGRGAFGSAL